MEERPGEEEKVTYCGNLTQWVNEGVPYLTAVGDWLQKVDLLKWIVTIAIPTSAIWLFKWLSAWRVRRAAAKKSKDDFDRFINGLPSGVQQLLNTFVKQEAHTVLLYTQDESVQLANGLGVVSLVSVQNMGVFAHYRLRDDIWEHFHNDIMRKWKANTAKKRAD